MLGSPSLNGHDRRETENWVGRVDMVSMAHGSERRGSQGGTLLLLYRARWKVNIYYVHPRLNKGEAAGAGLSSRGVVDKPDTGTGAPVLLSFVSGGSPTSHLDSVNGDH